MAINVVVCSSCGASLATSNEAPTGKESSPSQDAGQAGSPPASDSEGQRRGVEIAAHWTLTPEEIEIRLRTDAVSQHLARLEGARRRELIERELAYAFEMGQRAADRLNEGLKAYVDRTNEERRNADRGGLSGFLVSLGREIEWLRERARSDDGAAEETQRQTDLDMLARVYEHAAKVGMQLDYLPLTTETNRYTNPHGGVGIWGERPGHAAAMARCSAYLEFGGGFGSSGPDRFECVGDYQHTGPHSCVASDNEDVEVLMVWGSGANDVVDALFDGRD